MAAGDVKVSNTKVRAFNCNVFDGVDDYVEVPHHPYQLGAYLANGFTISAQIMLRTYGESNVGIILDKSTSNTGGDGFVFSVENSGAVERLRIRINDSAGIASANGSILLTRWYCVMITVSYDSKCNFYINGVLSGAADQVCAQNISAITTTNVMRIGNRVGDTDRSFNGSIKGVKMWNRVLTTAEIAADYARTTPTPGLIHHFKLGGDYADYGMVGATATNSGSVAQTVDDNVAVAVKAQRVGANDKWMIYRGQGGQVGTVEIEA